MKRKLLPLLKAVERCRDSWGPRSRGTILYDVLKVPWRMLRLLLPDYRDVSQDGIFFRESELWMCSLLPIKILDWLIDNLQPKSILDIGCGTGKSLDYFLERGIDVQGIEGSTLAVSKAKHPE